MSRVEHEREDLLREATALRERAALLVPVFAEPVTCGFRTDSTAGSGIPAQGSLSIYFGQDPAYHFDSEGDYVARILRACLFRSQGTTLARLTRIRSDQETTLSRHDLSQDECREFLLSMTERLQTLLTALVSGTATVQAQCLPILICVEADGRTSGDSQSSPCALSTLEEVNRDECAARADHRLWLRRTSCGAALGLQRVRTSRHSRDRRKTLSSCVNSVFIRFLAM